MTRSSLDLLADRLYDQIQGLSREDALHRIRLVMAQALDLEVLTLRDVARIVGRSHRSMERLVTLESTSGVACLPAQIPGLKHRYTRESVRRWLRSGVPAIARREAA